MTLRGGQSHDDDKLGGIQATPLYHDVYLCNKQKYYVVDNTGDSGRTITFMGQKTLLPGQNMLD